MSRIFVFNELLDYTSCLSSRSVTIIFEVLIIERHIEKVCFALYKFVLRLIKIALKNKYDVYR